MKKRIGCEDVYGHVINVAFVTRRTASEGGAAIPDRTLAAGL